ncbi:Coprox [Symbiodinium sp. KB8]|nr:Coprox [Symbiodinium sp. KB8]
MWARQVRVAARLAAAAAGAGAAWSITRTPAGCAEGAKTPPGSIAERVAPVEVEYPLDKVSFLPARSPGMRGRMEDFILGLQDEICSAIEAEDGGKFQEDQWERSGHGGGGRSRVLQDSKHFEKAGVNVSVVHGKLPKAAVQQMKTRGREIFGDNPPFYACGISLVMHPRNPHAPTVHANFRYFEVTSVNPESGEEHTEWWFGGGADLTPNYLYEEDALHFHSVLADACNAADESLYPRFKKWCDKYFFIKHRGEARGIGGVFFDDMDASEGSQEDMFAFVHSVGKSFVPAFVPILAARKNTPFTPEEVAWKRLRGGRYTEFNLVYDRGTKFGLHTPGARIESILMSLPLHADWKYCHEPEASSREGRLMEVLRNPRDWLGTSSSSDAEGR